MKILICSPEVVPFAKTGGLADVAGSLPLALRELGHEVKVILPKYTCIDANKYGINKIIEHLAIPLGDQKIEGSLWEATFPDTDIPVYFISNDSLFGRKELYREAGRDYEDNLQRFAFFSRGVLEALNLLHWRPDVIHCNDWQSALVPVYLKSIYAGDEFYRGIKTLFTVHNLGYQGLFPAERFPLTGLGWEYYTMERLEFYSQANLLKGGLVYGDIITTVSPTYSREILTPEYGAGLDGILRTREKDLYGVINGIDYNEWSPSGDRYISKQYSEDKLSGKRLCKEDLQEMCDLPLENHPVIGMISRLADQKGFDILAEAIGRLIRFNIQLVILGTGEPKYHELLERAAKKYPRKLSIHLTFNNTLAHKIEAGTDMFLMPSLYEPCGLNQLYSLAYGTVPIVRKTGGLADTIVDYNPLTGEGTGFVFEEYSADAMIEAIKRALAVYRKKGAWTELMRNGMRQDFSWRRSAIEYVKLYQRAMERI